MSLGVFLTCLMFCGLATGAAIDDTSKRNETGRLGRASYGNPQQFAPVDIGYYSHPDTSSTSTESEDDLTPKRDVPTSFNDFNPSDRPTSNKYKGYFPSKGLPPSINTWKGDWGTGGNLPMMPPTPADMAMMMQMMQAMQHPEQTPSISDGISGLLSKIASDPILILLPLAMLLASAVPLIFPLLKNVNSDNTASNPIITTVASGNNGRKRSDNPSFVTPILQAIESFSGRSLSEPTCLQKTFCEATKGVNGTDSRPVQKSIYKAFTFVDDYWLDALGVKQLMDALGTGNCDKLNCDALPAKKSAVKQKKV